MIFTLEAMQADEGDCLILHYGTADKPHFVVIDGGPAGVYAKSLSPRLKQLQTKFKRASDQKLPIELAMVSHIDDDHITGINDWVSEMEKEKGPPCAIRTFWFNSFDDLLGNAGEELRGRAASLGDTPPSGSPDLPSFEGAMAVIASVTNGRKLRARIDKLNIDLNGGFGGGLIMMEEGNTAPATLTGGLKLHVAGPQKARLADLQKDWDENVKAHPDPVKLAAFVDKSVPNLSSIVVVAEFGGKKMLLTGDARGDDIVAGLKILGMLDNKGAAHFDVIKMPHHGSNRNMTLAWLQSITAEHYVISANGKDTNPDAETVEWICQSRAGKPQNLYLTNKEMQDTKKHIDVGKDVQKKLTANPNPKRKVVFRAPSDLSLKVELGDAIGF